ncbi:DDE-type integrase/transposase/recombinase [Phenylobacterium sp.]|uniref:DDE-type integrase/transposase/recombinase n=1 Tax=Phenylobacterium sp. TaxID=1871053 RepID=UPI00289F4C49|nr:DDE-type integrase/transposase/recombinase [Phenylobacterium sp.]
MNPSFFNVGSRWLHCGKPLRFANHLGDKLLHFLDETTGGPFQIEDDDGRLSLPDMEWALSAFANGELKGAPDPHGSPVRRKAALQEFGPIEAARLDPLAQLRAFVVRGLDDLRPIASSDRAYRTAIAELWAKHPDEVAAFPRKPSPRTVRRWMEQRGTPGERPLSQMISMSGRVKRRQRLPPLVKAEVRRAALWYWSGLKRPIKDAYARLFANLEAINLAHANDPSFVPLSRPSSETLRKEIRRTECLETYSEKFGPRAAHLRFKPAGQGVRAIRILQIGEMDHTLIDNTVVFDGQELLPLGRPWLTVILDVYSNCIVGFVVTFEPPSLYSVIECIKRANRPKDHVSQSTARFPDLCYIFGRFDEIIVDNGMDFSGTSLHDGLADLGISLRLAPVRSPTYKAAVERFFGTLNSLLFHKLPGAVFKPDALREFDYDPTKDAVLTLSELEEFLWDALALYHITPQRGRGIAPAQLWMDSAKRHTISVIGDDAQLDKMLGALKECRVTRSGVELFGLVFHDEAGVAELLEDLIEFEPVREHRKGSATAKVKVKYNPASLAEIHVWNRRTNRYVTLPCTDEQYAQGVSLWHHRRLQELALQRGEEFSTEDDRLRLRATIVRKIEESAPTLRAKERRALARLLHSPKIQGRNEGEVGLAYALSRHDGMAPVTEYDLAAPTRSDGGQRPTRPARKKKQGPVKARRAKAARNHIHLQPETGDIADFAVDLSTWKEIDL